MQTNLPEPLRSIEKVMLPYQRKGLNFLMKNPYAALFFEMGRGKTLITLTALFMLNPKTHVLIIAPKPIARSTWQDEINHWHFPFRTQSLITDSNGKELTKNARIKLYSNITSSLPTVYFINWEKLAGLADYFKSAWPFGFVVVDEMQRFKSASSKCFKAFAKVRPYMQRVIGLSGTPMPHGIEDLWSQMYMLDMGKSLGSSLNEFHQTYMEPDLYANYRPITWVPKSDQTLLKITNRIKHMVLSSYGSQINLPEVTYNLLTVKMNEEEYQLYQQMVQTYVINVNDHQIKSENPAVLALRLCQMASGTIYVTAGSPHYEVIHKRKLEMLECILNNSNSPVLIAWQYRSELDMIKKWLAKHNKPFCEFHGEPELIKSWNERKIPIMLLYPGSTGFGINLQQGGHTLVWYSIPTSMEQYLQCNARLHRLGQPEPVIIHHLITSGTIDEKLIASLQRKELNEQELIKNVRLTLDEMNIKGGSHAPH